MYTGARSIQGHVVYKGSLYTGERCIKGYVVYRGTLYTGARCTQRHVVYRDTLYTGDENSVHIESSWLEVHQQKHYPKKYELRRRN